MKRQLVRDANGVTICVEVDVYSGRLYLDGQQVDPRHSMGTVWPYLSERMRLALFEMEEWRERMRGFALAG